VISAVVRLLRALPVLGALSLMPVSVSGGAAPVCVGDVNLDGQVSISELVRAVNDALNGCSGAGDRPEVSVSLTTDKQRYRVGETMVVTMVLATKRPALWWSSWPSGFDGKCVLDVRISRGHFFAEELLYDRFTDFFEHVSCETFDGGPRRVQRVVETPPAFEVVAEIDLVRLPEGGRTSPPSDALPYEPIGPGIYYVGGELLLGMVPEGENPRIVPPPDSPRPKGGVNIEIY